MGLGLFGYVNRRREPLRLANLHEHPESVGFPENHPPMKTFLGIPILHPGENFGNLYLTEKDAGQEFTQEDEEILVMFASHVAVVIANARRYSHRSSRGVMSCMTAPSRAQRPWPWEAHLNPIPPRGASFSRSSTVRRTFCAA